MTACLMCGEDADALLTDLEASKADARRLRLQLNRLRAKHRRFADTTNVLLTEQANNKELHTS